MSLPYQKYVSKFGTPYQKSVFQNQSSLQKIGHEKSVFKNRSSLSKIRVATEGVETRWLGWQFLDGL